jgi:hypothetical protein
MSGVTIPSVSDPSSPQEASERNARNALTVHFTRALVIVFASAKCPVSKPFYVTPRLGGAVKLTFS